MLIVNPHQRCGYSGAPFTRKDTFPYCRVWKWVGESGHGLSGEVEPKKKHFFLIEKYIEDARQDEKHVPELLEAIMRPTDPVRRVTAKVVQN